MMRTLADDRYDPVTSMFAFIEAPPDEVAGFLRSWREGLGTPVSIRPVDMPFPASLSALEPLTVGTHLRELLLQTPTPWTAYFDNGAPRPDPRSAVTVTAQGLGCRAIIVGCASMPAPPDRAARAPSNIQFDLLGPESRGGFLYLVRSIQMAWDGSRYLFFESGQPQPYEEAVAYSARRVRDRCTTELLERYTAALGIRLFDEGFYGPTGMLVENSVEYEYDSFTIEQAKARWGVLTPG